MEDAAVAITSPVKHFHIISSFVLLFHVKLDINMQIELLSRNFCHYTLYIDFIQTINNELIFRISLGLFVSKYPEFESLSAFLATFLEIMCPKVLIRWR